MNGPNVLAYRKKAGAKATVGEAQGIARAEAEKAVLVARWAVFVASLALVVSLLAIFRR